MSPHPPRGGFCWKNAEPIPVLQPGWEYVRNLDGWLYVKGPDGQLYYVYAEGRGYLLMLRAEEGIVDMYRPKPLPAMPEPEGGQQS